MGCNAKKRRWVPKNILRISKWAVQIMADGLYAVFHRFEAFLKKRLTHK